MMALRTEKLLRHSADARRVEGSCAERLPSILDGTQGRHSTCVRTSRTESP